MQWFDIGSQVNQSLKVVDLKCYPQHQYTLV